MADENGGGAVSLKRLALLQNLKGGSPAIDSGVKCAFNLLIVHVLGSMKNRKQMR